MEPKKQTSMGEDEAAVEKREEDEGRKKGGRVKKGAPHHARKFGGHVPGKTAASRPDRRARGGGADAHPESSAGKMSTMDYERGTAPKVDEGGAGPDKRVTGK